jgi:hypothetical protein
MRRKRKNPNAPRKGSKIKVEPICSLKDIQLIRRMLQEKPRDLALLTLGINTNLRASTKGIQRPQPGQGLVQGR